MLNRVLVSFRDQLCSLPLGLEVDCFGVPFLNGSWYSIHGYDLLHKRGGNSGREMSNEDIWIFDVGPGDMVLNCEMY